jgi:hypothetical protein
LPLTGNCLSADEFSSLFHFLYDFSLSNYVEATPEPMVTGFSGGPVKIRFFLDIENAEGYFLPI